MTKKSLHPYAGQCFCHPTKDDCIHCNRARQWVDRDVYTLANELGADIDIDSIENPYVYLCPECNEPMPGAVDLSNFEECPHCEMDFTHVKGCNVVEEPQEVMQWFIVSKWLYEKLFDQGEPVADWKDQYWWGRTCCGQGIELDGTFQAISRELDND